MTNEPQRDVQQIVTLLRQTVALCRMGYSERYDEAADAFYAETHLIAPGRSIPPGMNAGDAYERVRSEKWDAWTKARAERWTQAMADAAELLDRLSLALLNLHVTALAHRVPAELPFMVGAKRLIKATNPLVTDAQRVHEQNPCRMCRGTGIARPISQEEIDEAFRSLESVERMLADAQKAGE